MILNRGHILKQMAQEECRRRRCLQRAEYMLQVLPTLSMLGVYIHLVKRCCWACASLDVVGESEI